MALALEYNNLVQKFRPAMRGLHEVQNSLFSIRGGISSVLVGDTKCNVLLEQEKESVPFIPRTGVQKLYILYLISKVTKLLSE